jgi:polar amino acid transport system substrate-binding protein
MERSAMRGRSVPDFASRHPGYTGLRPGYWETIMSRFFAFSVVALFLCATAQADDRVPTGTLRVTYIATNPVQASIDPKTGETRGPGAEVARAIAKHLGVPVKITGVAGPAGVLDSLKKGEADIGLLAFDPARAKEVDFSVPYSLAQNTYLVTVDSPIQSVADIDKPGIRVGVTERDAGELYLSRALKAAEIKRNTTGNLDVVTKWLAGHEVDAYGTNRQRLTELAERNPGYRLLPDNFYGVEQSVIVPKGNKALLDEVNAVLDEARRSGLIAQAIERSGLIGLDVAPARP